MIKKKPKSTVICLAWHPNNQIIAVGSYDYRVRIYSAYIKAVDNQLQTSAWGKIANTGELLHEFQSGKDLFMGFFWREKLCLNLESGWIHDVAFSPSGESVAWVSHNSIIFAVSSNNPSRFV
jgi:actin related protein 2/3 complex subunit 1A/1B